MVRDSVREMVLVARALAAVPSGEHIGKGELDRHIKADEVEEIADEVIARMGVTRVESADARRSSGEYRRSSYPLFVEGGTRSPIFPARAAAMWNPAEGIFGRTSVRGQRGKHFMLATYQQAREILRADPHISLALKEMAARAAAERVEIEIT